MANFLLEAKGYQNAASWKNGSAFRLDERRDDLVGQKPNYTLYKPNLAWFLFIFCWKSSEFSGKKKTRKLSSHFLIRGIWASIVWASTVGILTSHERNE